MSSQPVVRSMYQGREFVAYTSSLGFLLLSGIFILLCLGVVSDLRTREVSNKIAFGVFVLSFPLIAWNMANIGFWNFAYLGVFVAAYFKGLGGADLKVLFPLLFIFEDVKFFAGSLAIFGIIYFIMEHYKHREVPLKTLTIPYFVPITITFILMVIV